MRDATEERTQKRVRLGLRQTARMSGRSNEEADSAAELAARIAERCGESSHSRQMRYRIGKALLARPVPIVVAPVCPDYHHENGRYTFRGLSDGIPLLARHHHAFLTTLKETLPESRVHFLIADQESEDAPLRNTVGKSSQEFHEAVLRSRIAIEQALEGTGWSSHCMTEFVPSLKEREKECVSRIRSNPSYSARINSETMQRTEMYWRINPSFTHEERLERTLRTAAQYLAFGEYAAEEDWLICNHTTVNLSWYKESGAALLHNPISVY